jgi:hypothetical protein
VSTWTQTDIDTLKEAVASGVLTVSFSGPPARTITYQNLDAMRKLLAEMIADVANAAGTRSNFRYAAFRKGFNSCD